MLPCHHDLGFVAPGAGAPDGELDIRLQYDASLASERLRRALENLDIPADRSELGSGEQAAERSTDDDRPRVWLGSTAHDEANSLVHIALCADRHLGALDQVRMARRWRGGLIAPGASTCVGFGTRYL